MAKSPTKPPPKSGHSPKIETLAGKTLANPKASATEKRLAGAVLSHGDGKPNPGGKK